MNKVAEFILDKNNKDSLSSNTDNKFSELRKNMVENSVDVWIIPTSDPHNCEYPPERWHGRAWLSGFHGSAGTLLITKDQALLWADGRYHIQAEKELKGSEIEVIKQGLPDVPEIPQWLAENLCEQSTIGFDGKSMPCSFFSSLKETLVYKDITYKIDLDLLNDIWHERPQAPLTPIFEHELKYAGKSRSEKLSEVRTMMHQKKADYFLISSLDDIAWLFNIRGSDVKNCSTSLSYALISQEHAHLCINEEKVSSEISRILSNDRISLYDYKDIFTLVKDIPEGSSIYLDRDTTSTYLFDCIPAKCRIISGINFTTNLKAIKNETEIENFRNCLIRDGIHVLKFMKWLEDSFGKEKITEVSVAKKINSSRAKDSLFHDQSFTTIAGFADNGALMHYLPSEESDTEISEDNFLLVDSGGLYQDGTTDITRTFAFGEMNEEQIQDYTLVVKSHIAMARTVFLRGCRGTQIDYAARADMWRQGINYNCATGHGVGFFLNVHEGPINVGQRFIDAELKPGMIITNEPGIYRQGKHGVRIENIMLCKEKETTEFGTFYEFETISPCPIETKAIDVNQLTKEEKDWLNTYHENVYELLSPHLDDEFKNFLKEKTKAL